MEESRVISRAAVLMLVVVLGKKSFPLVDLQHSFQDTTSLCGLGGTCSSIVKSRIVVVKDFHVRSEGLQVDTRTMRYRIRIRRKLHQIINKSKSDSSPWVLRLRRRALN